MPKKPFTRQSDGRPAHCVSRVAGRQPIVDVLAAAGAGPPERCTGMVRGGRVAVGGRPVRDPRAMLDPFREPLSLDGRPLPAPCACRYLLFYKPYGVLCAFTDREETDLITDIKDTSEMSESSGGRPTLGDYIDVPGVYAAGRLDLDSEGLVLLTDDGWLIHRLAHPRFHQPKTYLAQVEGVPGPEALRSLRQGVMVKGRRTAPAQAELLSDEPPLPPRPVPIRYRAAIPTAWLRLVLTEGRKRQVRHMTAAVGHPTLRLVRVAIGPLELGDLPPGAWRELSAAELEALRVTLRWA